MPDGQMCLLEIDGEEDMGDSVSKKELDGILSDFDALKAEHNID
jgi:hypothetical protein